MRREKLVELLKECQRKKQSVGIWYTIYGMLSFVSGQIVEVNFLGIRVEGSYFIYFEGDATTIVKISSEGRIVYKRKSSSDN